MTDEQLLEQQEQQQDDEPKEIVIQTATGAVFKGKTNEEIIESMKRSIEHGSETIRNMRGVHEQQQREIESLRNPKRPNEFDSTKYYDTLGKDPLEANRQAIEAVFGMPVEQLKKRLDSASEVTQKLAVKEAIAQFAADVPESVQCTQAEMMAMNTAMEEKKLEWTTENLVATYHRLKNQGIITTKAEEGSDSQETKRKAPPSARGRSGGGGGSGKRPEDMTTEELRNHINRQVEAQG